MNEHNGQDENGSSKTKLNNNNNNSSNSNNNNNNKEYESLKRKKSFKACKRCEELKSQIETLTDAFKDEKRNLRLDKINLMHEVRKLRKSQMEREIFVENFCRQYEQKMIKFDETLLETIREKKNLEILNSELKKEKENLAKKIDTSRQQLMLANSRILLLERERTTSTKKKKGQTRAHSASNLSPLDRHLIISEPIESLINRNINGKPISSESLHSFKNRDKDVQNEESLKATDGATDKIDRKRMEEDQVRQVVDTWQKLSKKRTSFSNISKFFGRNRNSRSDLRKTKSLRDFTVDEVAAWFDQFLGMACYKEEIKDSVCDGKMLLGVDTSALSSIIKFKSPLHCRKVKIALERYRNDTSNPYSLTDYIDNYWVSTTFLEHVGLTRYANKFTEQLIDGPVLLSLVERDLEEFLEINESFHKISIICGIAMMKILSMNKNLLEERQKKCETIDEDLLVWSNYRVRKWLDSINLQQYSDKIVDSGIHGAVFLLDEHFQAEYLVEKLAISQRSLRKHLSERFEVLTRSARPTSAIFSDSTNERRSSANSWKDSLGRILRGRSRSRSDAFN
ncbi:DgyrCDS13061 [Dimorphilus gyrociliatus]|nr:DgyrCDS13061 [Dimorphilus gyrociliatus]